MASMDVSCKDAESQIVNGGQSNRVAVVLGAQWGDEGKGKIVDLMCSHKDIICRCQVKFISQVHTPTINNKQSITSISITID